MSKIRFTTRGRNIIISDKVNTTGRYPSLEDVVDLSDISGLLCHLDASAIDVLEDEDPVEIWEDLSGNTNGAQSINNNPVYKINVFNGKPVVRFSNSPMEVEGLQFNSDFTLIIVMKPNALSGIQSVLEQYDWISNYGTFIFRQNGSRIDLGIIEGVAHRIISGTLINDVQLVMGEITTEDFKVYINGNLEGNNTHPYNILSSSTSFTIGARGDTKDTHFFKGDIGEILVYDKKLSDSEREKIEEYLMKKWSISN